MINNKAAFLLVLLLLVLLKPWRASHSNPSVDGVGLKSTPEQVLRSWGEPGLREVDENGTVLWRYSHSRHVVWTGEQKLSAVRGKVLYLGGRRVPNRTLWLVEKILGPPDDTWRDSGVGTIWSYNSGINVCSDDLGMVNWFGVAAVRD